MMAGTVATTVVADPMPRPDRRDTDYGPAGGILGFLAVFLFFYVLLDGKFRRGGGGPKR
jgi:hypothetical protein